MKLKPFPIPANASHVRIRRLPAKKFDFIVGRALRLLPYRFTPLGAVRAYIHYLKVTVHVQEEERLVRAVVAAARKVAVAYQGTTVFIVLSGQGVPHDELEVDDIQAPSADAPIVPEAIIDQGTA